MRVLQSYCNHASAAQHLEKIIAEAEKGSRLARATPLPRPAKQLRPDDITQILTLWHETHSITAMTRILRWDYGTIRRHLVAAGIDTAWRSIPKERDTEIIRLHAEGKSTRQIAKAIDCSPSTAWMTIRGHQAA